MLTPTPQLFKKSQARRDCEQAAEPCDLLEEAVGLPSAFRHAGFRTVIATTWPTKDSVAFVTLAGFLQHRLDHPEDPVALALRHTRTWLRTATRDDLTTWLSEVARQAQIPEELVELPGQWWSEHPEPVPFADPQDWAPYAAIGP